MFHLLLKQIYLLQNRFIYYKTALFIAKHVYLLQNIFFVRKKVSNIIQQHDFLFSSFSMYRVTRVFKRSSVMLGRT